MTEVTISTTSMDEAIIGVWNNYNYDWEDIEMEWTLPERSISTQAMSEITAPSVP